jgi:lipopolysaccharide transport system ATP-binding protein
MASGFSEAGERVWAFSERPRGPFKPLAMRVRDKSGHVVDVLRSTEPISVEIEYALESAMQGLRVGIYLMSMRGEHIFTSFDTDDPNKFQKFGVREPGRYISRCVIPPDMLNEGRYVLGLNASIFRVDRFFQDERALTFTVDTVGAPGKQWSETRLGLIRPRLIWEIAHHE